MVPCLGRVDICLCHPKSSVIHRRSSRTESKASCVKGQVPDTPWCPAGSPSPLVPRCFTLPGQFSSRRPIGRLFSHRAFPQAVCSAWNVLLTYLACIRLQLNRPCLPTSVSGSQIYLSSAFFSHSPCASLPQDITRSLFLCWLCYSPRL